MIRLKIAQEILKKTKYIYESSRVEYENLFGLSEIQKCHDRLNNIETSIVEISNLRREKQKNLNENMKQITEIRTLIDKTSRSNEQYIGLILKENDLLKNQTNCETLLKEEEEKERQLFSQFSSNLRMSYQLEVERRRKHYLLSIAYAVIVAFFGYFCDFFKFKNVKKYIYDCSESLKHITVVMNQFDGRLNNLEKNVETIESDVSKLPKFVSDIFYKLPATIYNKAAGKSDNNTQTTTKELKIKEMESKGEDNTNGYFSFFSNKTTYVFAALFLITKIFGF